LYVLQGCRCHTAGGRKAQGLTNPSRQIIVFTLIDHHKVYRGEYERVRENRKREKGFKLTDLFENLVY